MDNLQQQIENLRTLQESYDQIASDVAEIAPKIDALVALDSDLLDGKIQMAASISAMGVPATYTDSLNAMAAKVRSIPQQVNTRTSEFEQMIAPSPYVWNVYSVATDLMKETLPDYLPAYMSEYRQRYGTNSWFVGEYYRGYASLELTGADGYLTHDGCFYTIAEGVVTRTAPDGTVTTYEASSIVHTWIDGEMTQANRWVAFFYLNDAYGFTNTSSSICPRRVALCGTCNSFVVSGDNRLTDVWVIGTLGHFEGGTTGGTWNPMQVIRNYKTHGSGVMYNNASGIRSIILPDLEVATGNIIKYDYTYGFTVNLEAFMLPRLTTLSKPLIWAKGSGAGSSVTVNLPALNINNIEAITGDLFHLESSYNTLNIGKGTILNMPSIKSITGGLISVMTNINTSPCIFFDEIILDNLETGGYIIKFGKNQMVTTGLKRIYAPKYRSGIIFNFIQYYESYLDDLYDLFIGEYNSSLNLRSWRGNNINTYITNEQLNTNIVNGIANRVADRTGLSALTITFNSNIFNKLTQETKDAFTAKNWNVASA